MFKWFKTGDSAFDEMANKYIELRLKYYKEVEAPKTQAWIKSMQKIQIEEQKMIDKDTMEYLTMASWLRGYSSGLAPERHEAIIYRLERASDMLHAIWVERSKEGGA